MQSTQDYGLVFISYSSRDIEIASSTQNYLESLGINCWMAPGSIRPGEQWAEAIARVIPECSIMVLLWTSESMKSRQVINELTLADRAGVLVIPFRLENIEPEGAFRYYLYKTHWLDALDNAWRSKLKLLGERIIHNLPANYDRDEIISSQSKERKIQVPRSAISIGAFVASLLISLPFAIDRFLPGKKPAIVERQTAVLAQAKSVDTAVATVQDLYLLLTDRQYEKARKLLRHEIAWQINSEFFNQFDRVTVEELKKIGITGTTVNLKGVVTFVWPDGSIQKESRTFAVKTTPNPLITSSEFGMVLQSR